jgi:hypothetical protein
LETKDHSLAIGHNLIHIQFDVGDVAGGVGEVEPRVVEKVVRLGIDAEGHIVSFTTVIGERGFKLAGISYLF